MCANESSMIENYLSNNYQWLSFICSIYFLPESFVSGFATWPHFAVVIFQTNLFCFRKEIFQSLFIDTKDEIIGELKWPTISVISTGIKWLDRAHHQNSNGWQFMRSLKLVYSIFSISVLVCVILSAILQ